MKTLLYLFFLTIFLWSCGSRSGNGSLTVPPAEELNGNNNGIKTGIKIGERAPELVYESPTGEKISLSSLRGKLVLIDFWAAWCSPCRQENPNLVRTYKKFKDKEFQNGNGFTIYGISLDRRMLDWTTAIEKDGLIWESHVSDLKGWQSVAAAQYGVMQIPANFLIDGDGIILAKDLRGDSLEIKLKELLN